MIRRLSRKKSMPDSEIGVRENKEITPAPNAGYAVCAKLKEIGFVGRKVFPPSSPFH